MGGSESKIEKRLAGAPVVAVIGGGYGGIAVAKALDNKANVVVFDRKQFFYHNIASLRVSVAGASRIDDIALPYTNVLKHGHVVQAEVTEIDPRGKTVRVHGHEHPIRFDYLVIATGTSYAFPLKVAEPTVSRLSGLIDHFASEVRTARKVVVVGGGPVGVELCGEIRDAHADKEIVLVHSDSALVSGVANMAFRVSLAERLGKVGVQVLLGERVVVPDEARRPGDDASGASTSASTGSSESSEYTYTEYGPPDGPTTVTPGLRYLSGRRDLPLVSGKVIPNADLIVFATGAATNSSCYRRSGFKLGARERIVTDEFLRVTGDGAASDGSIFAIGDCADTEAQMGFLAGEQGKHVASVITASIQGKLPKPYKKGPKIMVVPIGANEGAMMAGESKVLGRTVTRMLKGKDLFIPKQREALGFSKKAGTQEPAKGNEVLDVEKLAASLNVSLEEATLIASQAGYIEHGPEATHT